MIIELLLLLYKYMNFLFAVYLYIIPIDLFRCKRVQTDLNYGRLNVNAYLRYIL